MVGEYRPNFMRDEEIRNQILQNEHPEFAKAMLSTLPMLPDADRPVSNAGEAELYDEYEQFAVNYFKVKWQKRETDFKNQITWLDEGMLPDEFNNMSVDDDNMAMKLDFMYDYLDYDHDRAQVREKFLKDVNKRTTLEDIGETLDRLTYASKAQDYKYYSLADDHDKYPDRASKEFSSEDFKWSAKLLRSVDPKTPMWLDDKSQLN